MDHSPTQRSFPLVFLALLSLTTFALSQSVYQALVGNAEFVVLNQISRTDLLLIVFCFNVLPATALALVWLGVRTVAPKAADTFLSAAFLLLLAPFLLELHKRSVPSAALPPQHSAPHNSVDDCGVGGFSVPLGVGTLPGTALPVILIFPGLFLWRAWSEVSPTIAPPASAIRTLAAADTGKCHPPVFILVLDEFTRPALLDSEGKIDSARFPHFVELASQSTWFTNATANAEYTTRAIPVIVTGNFPQGNDPSDAAYPDNFFRLLAPEYGVTIHEEVTRFCASPAYHCPDASLVRQQGHLLKAVAKLYLMRIAPNSIAIRLQAADLRAEQQRFQEFLSEIGRTPGSRPPLMFVHYQLPHAPYMLTSEGVIQEESPGGFDPAFAGNTKLVEHLRHNYERQVEFVDRELGRFIDKLKQTGLYDSSLIVVTSDHGVSWKSEAPGRVLSDANAEMILPIPLFIKLPGQREGKVSSRDAQSIDLVPTIAAIVGVKVPWQTAVRDLFGPDEPPRQKVMIDSNGKRFTYPPTFAATINSESK